MSYESLLKKVVPRGKIVLGKSAILLFGSLVSGKWLLPQGVAGVHATMFLETLAFLGFGYVLVRINVIGRYKLYLRHPINALTNLVNFLSGVKRQVIKEFPVALPEYIPEYIEQLERYVASESKEASRYQFFTEIGAIEGIALGEVKVNIQVLAKKLEQYSKLSTAIENQSLEETSSGTAYKQAFQLELDAYRLLNEIVADYWNYLPSDFQDSIEDCAYFILKCEFFVNYSSQWECMREEAKEILRLAYSLLDEIEKSSLKLKSQSVEEEFLLEDPKHTFKESWDDLTNNQTFPISEL